MAKAQQTWSVPGVILFSHGELVYEVDLSRPLSGELVEPRLGESLLPAWERMNGKRLREVIVRTLPPESGAPEALARMRARLREEARLATYLRHPNIARTDGPYEVQGVLYVVSARLEGVSLDTLLSQLMHRGAFVSIAFCLYVGAEVARALHHAHTRQDEHGRPLGILHRDVHPARICLGTGGEVLLTDFARARSLLPGRVATTLPRPQGDVFYCAPEALLGEALDPRSDLFSLGLVLLELATWRHLYNMSHAQPADVRTELTPEAKEQVLGATLVALEAELPDYAEDSILRAVTFTAREVEALTQPVPPPLRSILRRVLQRRPEDRYPSAAALEAELREGLASLAGPYGAREALAEAFACLTGNRMNLHPEAKA
jgi:serine/threonine protein kinase